MTGEIKGFDCDDCPDNQKEFRGCETDTEFSYELPLVGEFFRCPVKMVGQRIRTAMRFYIHYKNGYLPIPGGVLDQSNTFLAACEILDKQIADIQKHQEERNKHG
jgi:hypothetical protein